jgi:hypothetical protein
LARQSKTEENELTAGLNPSLIKKVIFSTFVPNKRHRMRNKSVDFRQNNFRVLGTTATYVRSSTGPSGDVPRCCDLLRMVRSTAAVESFGSIRSLCNRTVESRPALPPRFNYRFTTSHRMKETFREQN